MASMASFWWNRGLSLSFRSCVSRWWRFKVVFTLSAPVVGWMMVSCVACLSFYGLPIQVGMR